MAVSQWQYRDKWKIQWFLLNHPMRSYVIRMRAISLEILNISITDIFHWRFSIYPSPIYRYLLILQPHTSSRDPKISLGQTIPVEESVCIFVWKNKQIDAALCLSHTLTHQGRVTHICVNEIIIIGSDNVLSPERRQTIIWTNDGILLIGPFGTNFSEILSEFKQFHSRKCTWKCRLRNGVHFVSASMC